MSARAEAFVHVTVKCPICAREGDHRYIKQKVFQPITTEGDGHVLERKWESPRFTAIQPDFYNVWYCPHCHFVDEQPVFRGEDKDRGKLELLKEKILIIGKAPTSVLSVLGSAVEMEREFLSIDTAMITHLLAIYTQEMLSPNMRNYGKLGRLYLRTAWLFREKKEWPCPEVGVPEGFGTFKEFFESLKSDWKDIPFSEEMGIERAIDNYKAELDRGGRVDDVKFEVAVMFLLVDLLLRLGRQTDALNYARSIFRLTTQKRQSTRAAMDAGVHRGKLSAERIEQMKGLINWLNNAIERATAMDEAIKDKVFDHEYPTARTAVLEKFAEAVADEEDPLEGKDLGKQVMLFLRDEKFSEATVRRVATLAAQNMALLADHEVGKEAMEAKNVKVDEEEETAEQGGSLWDRMVGKMKGKKE